MSTTIDMPTWDDAADHFDDQPDHGLIDPTVRGAWIALMRSVLPAGPCQVADLGCGTGTLSVLLAGLGHRVHGVDLSPRMLDRAVAKSAGLSHALPRAATIAVAGAGATFARGDAARPPLRTRSFDVVLARHVLWALDEPAAVLERWADLLAPDGRLVLIEGRWSTGAGIESARLSELVRTMGGDPEVRPLSDPRYWGGPITDERYALVAEL
ncbi:MAG TPA: class I SAM-dependent methyltransferase [Acidimicrobiales bacterium]|nr:class I SAM-dependent methyltransferase [Acidimicrobiales bacterium]